MYCPIHNPSGGEYDPLKSQYKNRRHALTNQYGKGRVTLISTEKVPIKQRPYTPPETFSPDAAGVVQLDNTKKIITDFAAITVTFGNEVKKTFVFSAKLLPSNSPARQVSTAIQYLTQERLYSRSEKWVKQRRAGTEWIESPTYGSIDVVRCHHDGEHHTPPSPGPVGDDFLWENAATGQAVTTQFVYVTGFKDKMISQHEDKIFEFLNNQVQTIADQQNLTLAERELLLKDRINKVNNEMFIHRDDVAGTSQNINDFVIHPLDLVGATIHWVGPNQVDDVFVTLDNTSDMREWFMNHEDFHIPNKQMFVDNGFIPATFESDGSIYIRSNVRMMPFYINEEKVYVEANDETKQKYTSW